MAAARSDEDWIALATEKEINLAFLKGVDLEDGAHKKRLYTKFGVLGNDDDKVDQQIELLGFVKDYQANQQLLQANGSESPSKKTKTMEEKRFDASNNNKEPLPVGTLAARFGGLLDRAETKNQLYDGLKFLAKKRGKENLDKKEVPVLALSAPSESGKTEFLRWIFNSCCTYLQQPLGNATDLLTMINQESPPSAEPLNNILVLFASFNQESTHYQGEGPIVQTTVERLLRSYEGNIKMGTGRDSWKRQRFVDFSSVEDIMDHFSQLDGKGKTAFIFCVDGLSNLRENDDEEYRRLMVELLQTSQSWLRRGGYCAVVASSLSLYDFGEVVLQTSGRCLKPIEFPLTKPEMTKKAEEVFWHGTDSLQGAQSSKEEATFWFHVTASVLESSPSVFDWERIMSVPSTTTCVRPPERCYKKPEGISFDEIFQLVARTVLRKQKSEVLTRERLRGVVDKLHGSVTFDGYHCGVMHDWEGERYGKLTLPAWRLLQFWAGQGQQQLFQWIQNWVVVETRKLFYVNAPRETFKTWELATMAVLELRKAMLVASCDSKQQAGPTMGDIIRGLNIHHNVEESILKAKSSTVAASNVLGNLPQAVQECANPSFWYSVVENEKGVEGVFRGGFEGQEGEISSFFQMKMHSKATPMNILDWLVKADDRAKDLGFETGTYVVQLFVTGAVEDNIENYVSKWPANSMVFGTEALLGLYEPFGNGIIKDLVDMRSRDR